MIKYLLNGSLQKILPDKILLSTRKIFLSLNMHQPSIFLRNGLFLWTLTGFLYNHKSLAANFLLFG